MEHLHVVNHPLLQHKLSILRDKETGTKDFRQLAGEIAALLCYEATQDLTLESAEVETPVGKATVNRLAGKQPTIVPILRAGLGMVEGVLTMLPTAKVGHIGLYRDETTLEPVTYYCKLPKDIAQRRVFLLDPMLATGGSASAAISFLKQAGAKHITFLNILAAPDGAARLEREHPDVEIYTAALDGRLNEVGYIVPGLGDAGDRIFGTP